MAVPKRSKLRESDVQALIRLRNDLEKLNLKNPLDRRKFEKELFQIIREKEKFEAESYKLGDGVITVGYGFNMGRVNPTSKEQKDEIARLRKDWNNFFKDYHGPKPDFDRVRSQKEKINIGQAEHLTSENRRIQRE